MIVKYFQLVFGSLSQDVTCSIHTMKSTLVFPHFFINSNDRLVTFLLKNLQLHVQKFSQRKKNSIV